MKSLEIFGAALSLGALTWSDVSVFEPAQGVTGDVRVYDTQGVAAPKSPAGLQGITLLPIEFTGRSLLEEGLAGRPALHADIPGAARIVLPAQQGSLYRFRRDGAGPVQFGYFIVRADGSAELLFAMDGTGALGDEDPLPGYVALASDGSSFLAGTSLAAGGNLLEIDVRDASHEDRTSTLGPLSFPADGLRLVGGWGVALTQQGVVRFDRSAGASAAFVTIPGAPLAFFGAGVVISSDESTAAFVGGSDASTAHVFVLRQGGPAVQATSQPRALLGAGFLPDCPNGPTLALAPDGSCMAFRSEGSSNEAWSLPTVSGTLPAFQITSSARFENTLGETGVIGFLSPTLLILTVGDGGGNQPLERADMFRVDLSTGAVANLTLTSGQVQVPYSYGWAIFEPGIWPLPDGSGALLVQRHPSGSDELLMTTWSTGSVTSILTDILEVECVTAAGSDLILEVVRDLPGFPREVWRLPFADPGSKTLLAALTEEDELLARMSRSDGSFAAAVELDGIQLLGRTSPTGTSGQLPPMGALSYGPTLVGDPSGTLFGSVGLGGRAYHFSWRSTGAIGIFGVASKGAFLLPGTL